MIRALHAWADAQTETPVIWANQDGTQPDGTYTVINVTSSSREGMPHISAPSDSGVVQIRQGQVVSLSVNTYGPDASATIQDLRDSLDRITAQQELRADGFAVVDVVSEPVDVAAVTGSTWQARWQMDVQFRTLSDISDRVGLIESVGFSGGNGTASDSGAIVGAP